MGDGADAWGCAACEATYDQVSGVPFLFHYEEEDFAGLCEIVANAGQVSPFTPDVLERWTELLSGYDRAPNKSDFLAQMDPNDAHWLPHRYSEWRQAETVGAGLDWRGKSVLDVGAGLGFDAWRFVRAGARVTALEFSPVLAREGARTLPTIRWVGGASQALPFVDASFDAVVANAALHHMRDIPAALDEMLRVLKPGGVLLTTGDSYRKSSEDETAELRIFNDHVGVLSGINERVPRFDEFMQTLRTRRAQISPRLFTEVVYGAWLAAGRKTVRGLREWPFAWGSRMLAGTSGALALRVRLLRPTGAAARRLAERRTLSPATLAGWLSNPSSAIANLAAWAPASLVNAPFPRGTVKSDLLSGWRRSPASDVGEAYLRGRWYLRRSGGDEQLCFEVLSERPAVFELLVNGGVVGRHTLAANQWTPLSAHLSKAAIGSPFSFEIRLTDAPAEFAHGLFRVRGRRFAPQAG